MKNKKVLGIISIVLGLLLTINSQINLPGVSLSPGISENISSIIGLFFVIIGALTLMSRRGPEYAQEILDTNRYIDNPKEMERIAKKSGYRLEDGYKEGTKV